MLSLAAAAASHDHSGHLLHFLLLILPLLLVVGNELVLLSRRMLGQPIAARSIGWRAAILVVLTTVTIHFMPAVHIMAHHNQPDHDLVCCTPKLAEEQPPVTLPAIIKVGQVTIALPIEPDAAPPALATNKSPPTEA